MTDISKTAGDDITLTGSVSYNGAPLNLSGYTVTALLRPTPASKDYEGKTYALTVTDAASGSYQWDIPHADTEPPGHRPYRIWITDSSGRVYTVVSGILALTD